MCGFCFVFLFLGFFEFILFCLKTQVKSDLEVKLQKLLVSMLQITSEQFTVVRHKNSASDFLIYLSKESTKQIVSCLCIFLPAMLSPLGNEKI